MENEIKVGEFVRFKNGIISKVVDCIYAKDYKKEFKKKFKTETKLLNYVRNKYEFDNRNGRFTDATIVKHSSNLIDIIEERRLCKWKVNT